MYVAVKGGERAIERSWDLLAANRRGDKSIAKLGVDQIREQLRLAIARVITEGSVYDEELAALAIKQAAGDLVEAIFLLRAYRTTLPRFGYTVPLDTEAMLVERRISATFKDIPGGQVLGGMYTITPSVSSTSACWLKAAHAQPTSAFQARPHRSMKRYRVCSRCSTRKG